MKVTKGSGTRTTDGETRACSRCRFRRDITEFRFRNRATGQRHLECRSCHAAAERERLGLRRRKTIQHNLALLNRHRERRTAVEAIVAETIRSFGGLERFVARCKQHIDMEMAGRKSGSQFCYPSFRAIALLLQQADAIRREDDRYLKEEGVSFDVLKGCVPVDGDTYDIPKIIMAAEHRQALYGGKMFTFGHRQKFGNDPEKHVDFSAVTHVASDKGIPPFLILYFSGNPDTTAQARRLADVLKEAEIPVRAYGKQDSNHSRLNNDLGKSDDPVTEEFYKFLDSLVGNR